MQHTYIDMFFLAIAICSLNGTSVLFLNNKISITIACVCMFIVKYGLGSVSL